MQKIVQIMPMVLAGIVILIVAGFLAFEITFRNRVYPGVSVAGQELGGIEREQLTNVIRQKTRGVATLTLRLGVNEWTVSTADLGVVYDDQHTGELAFGVGRKGDLTADTREKISAIWGKVEIEPRFVMDERRLGEIVASIAGQINIPAMEPEVSKEGSPAKIAVLAGENGQLVNETGLKQKIATALASLRIQKIDIPIVEIRPKLSTTQVERARMKAESILGQKLEIVLEQENQRWELTDEETLTWIDLQNGGWKQPLIKRWVEDLAKAIDRPAQNASFRFLGLGRVEEFKPASKGIKINVEETTQELIEALDNLESADEEQRVAVVFGEVDPEIDTGEVNNLGIRELIGKGESWFTGSITNRIFNLKKAAEVLSGTLVAPGETFSFNDVVGEISAETGYKQAYIIKEGKTILGDGGGVCQVSTTLFRAVLASGLPIDARTAHAYRVSYYEVNYQVGYDATVFQPAPDFKFTNDTPGHILIQVVYDETKKYLAFEIYGTSDGRKAEVSKARVWDVVAPPPDLYIDDPNLPIGKVVQTEHAAKGAKVAFDWKVVRGDEILQERTFYSNYRPWQAVYMRGTKPI